MDSDALLPVGYVQKNCQENGQGHRKGNSQLAHFLTFYWTSPYGFDITKYLQMGKLKLDIILPVPIAVTTETIQAFLIFSGAYTCSRINRGRDYLYVG